uniref:Cytosol aminopeptidase domain-containing protein n=1 Tax=Arcella intermedia TaxID=1963864 RepID=A0A6B2L1Y9_9EUKA
MIAVQDWKAANEFDSTIVLLFSLEDEYPGKEEALQASKVDNVVGKGVTIHQAAVPGGRVILGPLGELNGDLDDVRNFAETARTAVSRAKSAGSTAPLLVFSRAPDTSKFPEYANALQVSVLGIFQELYVGLQAREAKGKEKVETIRKIGIYYPALPFDKLQSMLQLVWNLEAGKRLARDLGDGDPERMAPVNFADFVVASFKGSPVKVTVKSDRELLEKEYPLLMSVARGSRNVGRHLPRVIHLEYIPEGEVKETLYLVGKGVTYDTGGLDLKVGGIMAGMSRDKCGASNVAGILLLVGLLKPKNIKVVAELGVVRNTIGSESYAADEVITGHSGARVKTMNTDAEGRYVLADCLSHLRTEAIETKAPNPKFFTFATLTGHVVQSIGAYTAIIDNGPAVAIGQSVFIKKNGEMWGDASETSFIRKEDLKGITKSDPSFDVLQMSTGKGRGHQYASLFLAIASGLNKHGKDSTQPFPYSHFDIAGSAVENCDFQFGKVTASGLTAFAASYIFPNL